MTFRLVAVLAIALVLAFRVAAEEKEFVARVLQLTGSATVVHADGSAALPLAKDAPILAGDQVATGGQSRLRLRFADGSVLTLGERTELAIDRFQHAGPGLRDVLLSVPTGIVRALVRAVMNRADFEIRTQTAVASVRGTDWILQADSNETSVVVLEGRVTVASVDRRLGPAVVLGQGEGTTVARGAPPTPPKRWGQARVDSVIAATSLP
jgi:hypothetical protein